MPDEMNYFMRYDVTTLGHYRIVSNIVAYRLPSFASTSGGLAGICGWTMVSVFTQSLENRALAYSAMINVNEQFLTLEIM